MHTHKTLPVFLSRDANPCWPGARISHPRRGSLSWPRLRVRTRRGSRDSCLDCRISGATPLKSLGKQPKGYIGGRTLGEASLHSLSPLPLKQSNDSFEESAASTIGNIVEFWINPDDRSV